MPFKNNPFFSLSIENNQIKITLRTEGIQKIVTRSVPAARSYLLRKYNWNGIVKLMRFVYKKHDEDFVPPSELNGTSDDDVLLIPDMGIAYIVSTQLLRAIKDNQPFTAAKISEVLKAGDAMAGNGFCRDIIKKERLVFLNEMFNKTLKDPETGTRMTPPPGNAPSETFYTYFKKLVQLRNGLWSTKTGVVNIVGLRRVLVERRSDDAGYNDTIAVCWIDKDGKPQCELNIATTEPGNRSKSRQLFPQTTTLLPGYHNMRQPGGRTRYALKEGSNEAINRRVNKFNDKEPSWTDKNHGDTTMNFHQGGNNFLYPSAPGLTDREAKKARKFWLSKFGLTSNMQIGEPSTKADLETLFQLNRVLSEIFLILSRYGEKGNTAPYINLTNMCGHPTITRTGIIDGKITVSQTGQRSKVIDVADVKGHTVRFWSDGRRNEETKKKIYEILQHITDYTPEEIKTWREFNDEQVIAVIKDEHIERIVDIQIEYLTHISKGVDGIAGKSFYKMIAGILQKKADAEKDKVTLERCFEELKDLPLKSSIINVFKKSLKIGTYTNRKRVRNKTKHIPSKDLDVVADVTVGGYSAGCQVFFDTEVFYIFWTKLLRRAQESGQRRWYYNLIDATNFKKSEVI